RHRAAMFPQAECLPRRVQPGGSFRRLLRFRLRSEAAARPAATGTAQRAIPAKAGAYCALGTSKVKSTFAPSALTSTSLLTGLPPLALRWVASMVYLPGGTLAILKLPSLSLTAKYGLSTTVTQANIHGWTSHLNFKKLSGVAKLKEISGAPCAWALLASLLPLSAPGMICTLCMTGSEFFTTSFWPV